MTRAPLMRFSRPASRAARRSEAGWVLVATLILSALAISVTVTYARHALLAKKSLESGMGASPVEEASRSEMDRVRELMRTGDPPGTIEDGTNDESITPTGEVATGERKVSDGDAQKRDLEVHAQGVSPNSDDEYRTRVKAMVEPASGKTTNLTTVQCATGDILLSGSLMIITGSTSFSGVELTGTMLLESGSTLTLTDCVLHGSIITRHGACKDNPKCTGVDRPTIHINGGCRILSGADLPDTALCAPDAVFECDDVARVEVKGFACADEVKVKGKGSVKGMLVSGDDEEIDSTYTRPGHGRGSQAYPDHVEPGGEEIKRVCFPNTPIPSATLDLMCSAPIGS